MDVRVIPTATARRTLVAGAGALVSLIMAALLPLVVDAHAGFAIAGLAAVVLGVGAGMLSDRTAPTVLAPAAVAVSAVVGCSLLSTPGVYLPIVAVWAGLGVQVARRITSGGFVVRLPRLPILVVLSLYAAVVVVTSVTAVDRGVSAQYLVTILGALGLSIFMIPAMLGGDAGRRLAIVCASVGVTCVISSVVLVVVGPVRAFGHYLGAYTLVEPTWRGHRLGFSLPEASGFYGKPGYQSLALAVALGALLGVRQTFPGRWRAAGAVAAAGLIVGLLVTMARGGWLAGVAACLAVLVGQVRRRHVDVVVIAASGIVLLAAIAQLSGVLGAVARYDVAAQRYGTTIAKGMILAGNADVELVPSSGHGSKVAESTAPQVRGGSDSQSRIILWKASLRAIGKRPLTGFGPGTDALAIEDELSGGAVAYRGLTSHNTFLRTAVETGLVGGIAFAAFVILTMAYGAGALLRPNADANQDWRATTALVSVLSALAVAQLTETLLLGGVTFVSLVWAVATAVAFPGPRQILVSPLRWPGPQSAARVR